jgi:2-dehydro-3-deoxy-L-rhamnonate dehydrogenase (NAD+)
VRTPGTERVAVVTGAARGIGRAISRALLAEGLSVVGADADGAALRDTAAELGARFSAVTVDLTDAAAVDTAFEGVQERLGGLDVLVNNAGTCFMSDFTETSASELRQQLAVNFESAFHCCQRAVPLMLPRPGIKKIVNISSNGAYNFDVFDPAHYRASKAALDTLTKHLARRYAREEIAVNSIAPAMTRTDLFDVVEPAVLDEALAAMPRGKPLEPAEIAAWVAFLVSPSGDCCSGNVIVLNQGRDVR